jgi:hypothetical protein
MPAIPYQGVHEPTHPCPDSWEQGYQNLAFAIVAQCGADLEGANPKRRHEARLSVQSGVLALWLDLMESDESARRWVLALLDEMAS